MNLCDISIYHCLVSTIQLIENQHHQSALHKPIEEGGITIILVLTK
jgi:hypothetical protein